MFADSEYRPVLFGGEYNETRIIAVQWGTALGVVAVGIVGLLRDSWAKATPDSWLNVHALFGLLLCMSIVAQFYCGLTRPALVPPVDINAFTRHLSRLVYLLLYGLLGTQQIINIAHHRRVFTSAEDFQVYLAYGLLALIVIHALAAIWRHAREARIDSEH